MSDVRELDRGDEAALRSYWEIGSADAAAMPYDDWPTWEVARRTWPAPSPENEIAFVGVLDDDRMLGGAWLGLPVVDNTHLAKVQLIVHPDARRRGVGTALLAAVEAEVASRPGRTTYHADAVVPLGADPTTTPGWAFAAAHGFTHVSTDECKVVELATHADDLPALERRAAERSADYRLVSWVDSTPEEWLAGMCELYSSFLQEIPLEEADLRPEVHTPERVRGSDARRVERGVHKLTVAAVGPDGSVAGYTDVVVADGDPARGEVFGTLVLPAHRGHRLGLAMKARAQGEAPRVFPGLRTIATWNAGVNSHMNGVNTDLGYRVRQHHHGLQKVIS